MTTRQAVVDNSAKGLNEGDDRDAPPEDFPREARVASKPRRTPLMTIRRSMLVFLLPTIAMAYDPPVEHAPHPGWNEVLRVVTSKDRPIDASTLERELGVPITRRVRANGDYDAWIATDDDGKSLPILRLVYRPAEIKGQKGLHSSLLQIFVRKMECVSPERAHADLLRAGLTSPLKHAPSTQIELLLLGPHRSVRVTYSPSTPSGSRKIQAIRQHIPDEDRRCVEDILVDEAG